MNRIEELQKCNKLKDNKLSEVAKVFSKLGTIAFGGPAAHIAMMENEVVTRKKWMSREHFLDLVGITNLIPGPNSSEMAMHCGYERAGWKGLVVAGACFIGPAVLITAILAFLYQRYGQLPAVLPFVYGIKPAVIAIVLSALIGLGKKALKNTTLGILGGLTLLACLLGVHEIVALFVCGAMGIVLFYAKQMKGSFRLVVPISSLFPFSNGAGSLGKAVFSGETVFSGKAAFSTGTAFLGGVLGLSYFQLFCIFLKVGALLYGSGYVLFAFLDAELVSKGFLSRQVLMDAVAAGQFTPGPVLSTATFIGWQLKGGWGALLATLGIFLPSFLFVALCNPIIPKLRKSKVLSAFLDAVNIASVAVILAVAIEMGRDAITDWRSIVIALGSMIVLLVFRKLNSAFIVVGGAIAGYLLL